jgi:hypothetical protein
MLGFDLNRISWRFVHGNKNEQADDKEDDGEPQ